MWRPTSSRSTPSTVGPIAFWQISTMWTRTWPMPRSCFATLRNSKSWMTWAFSTTRRKNSSGVSFPTSIPIAKVSCASVSADCGTPCCRSTVVSTPNYSTRARPMRARSTAVWSRRWPKNNSNCPPRWIAMPWWVSMCSTKPNNGCLKSCRRRGKPASIGTTISITPTPIAPPTAIRVEVSRRGCSSRRICAIFPTPYRPNASTIFETSSRSKWFRPRARRRRRRV